jgi:hypothetical protein
MTPLRALLPMVLLLLVSHAHAAPIEVNGSGALALAVLVGGVSPRLAEEDKDVLTKLLNGQTDVKVSPGKTIQIGAEKVTCKAGNVDITSHSCDLVFGNKPASLSGRAAHELYATMAEVGVPPDGAAGSMYESVSNLVCTIDPNEVKEKSGGGAHCQYAPPN